MSTPAAPSAAPVALDAVPSAETADNIYENLDQFMSVSAPLLKSEGVYLPGCLKIAQPHVNTALERLPPMARAAVTKQLRVLLDSEPLPDNFDYSYSMTSYYWRTLMMVCLKLGQRIGSFAFVRVFLSAIFNSGILAVMTYVLLPVQLYHLHRKANQTLLSEADRRVLLMSFAFLTGLFSAHLLAFFVPAEGLPPPYFMPVVVGITIQCTGPTLGRDRGRFLVVTLGTASVVAVLVAETLDAISFRYLLSLSITVAGAFYNLQSLIVSLKSEKPDVIASQIVGLAIVLWSSAFDLLVWGRFDPRGASAAISATDIDAELAHVIF